MHRRYSNLNLFTADGRISRMTYFIFSLLMPILVFWILAATAGLLGKLGPFGETLGYALLLLAIIAAVIALLVITIQRSHDFNTSGWLALLVLILPPMVILFWLMPGTNGINSYGEQPIPLLKWFKWGALIIAIILAALTASLFYSHYM